MKLMNLKGTFDFLPEEQIIRNKIMDELKKVMTNSQPDIKDIPRVT